MKTGYCAANYRQTEVYSPEFCGPIRPTADLASADADAELYDGIRFVGSDGYLYVDVPSHQ